MYYPAGKLLDNKWGDEFTGIVGVGFPTSIVILRGYVAQLPDFS
jgi:hypothetical protein